MYQWKSRIQAIMFDQRTYNKVILDRTIKILTDFKFTLIFDQRKQNKTFKLTYMKLKNALILLFCISILAFHCRKSEPSWQVDLLSPLLHSSIGLEDLIADSLIKKDANGELAVVFQKKLYDIRIDSIFSFYDTGVIKSYNIDSLSLYNTKIDYPITLGQICRNSGFLGLFIASQHGNSIAVPAIPAVSSPAIEIDADSLFTTMTLLEGNIDITLKNGLPIDVSNVIFELRNASNRELLVSGNFPLIAAGKTETKTYSLAGKTVEGKLIGQLISLASPGSNGVPVKIDTNNAVIASINVYNLHPKIATAIFPAQNLINKSQPFILKGLPVFLKNSKIQSGQIILKLFSTLQDSVQFSYKLPSATKNGIAFEVSKTLDPAPPGGLSVFDKTFDFSGYNLNLSGTNGDTFNTAYNEFIAKVEYTGQKKTLSIQDSFRAQISFVNLRPEYATGYLGQQKYEVGPASLDIDLFKNVQGNFNLENVKFNIEAENFIGADAQVKINELQSVNTRKNTTISLTGNYNNAPLLIQRATDLNGNLPVTPSYASLTINSQNSNINSYINNLPDKINYSFLLETNPNGNVSNYKDFIYDGKFLNLNMNIEMPLQFSATGISLADTVDLDLNQNNIENIQSAILYLIADNGFPLESSIELTALDEAGNPTFKLLDGSQKISAGVLESNGKVNLKKRSKLSIPLDKNQIDLLIKTKKIKIVSTFDTKPDMNSIKIYDSYKIDFYLTGDFNYLVK